MLNEIKRKIKLQFKSTILSIQSIFFTFSPFKIYEFKELIRQVKFSKTDIILDIGCGEGLQTLIIGKKCKKIYGIDINSKWLSIAKLRLLLMKRKINCEFRLVRLQNAGFMNDYFNKIFSICVLEHISDYFEVLKECYRILKKNGQLILSVDSLNNIYDKNLLVFHQKKYKVEKYFNKEELEYILKKVGFKKIKVYPIFKSNYSKKLFIKCLKNNNNFGYISSILKYFIFKYKEKFSINKHNGIFLIANCFK